MRAAPYPKFSEWLGASLTLSPLSWLVIFYLLHFFLRIPASALVIPYAAFCAVPILLSPLLYLSRRYLALRGGDARPMFATLAVYSLAIGIQGVFFALRLGLLSRDHAAGYYGAVLAAVAIGSPLAYCFHSLIVRRR